MEVAGNAMTGPFNHLQPFHTLLDDEIGRLVTPEVDHLSISEGQFM